MVGALIMDTSSSPGGPAASEHRGRAAEDAAAERHGVQVAAA